MATLQRILTSRDIQRYIQSHVGLQENSQLVPISREDASKVLDEIWKVLDSAALPLAAFNPQFLQYRNKLRKLSLKLSITHDIFPSALVLREVQLSNQKLIGSGSFADVFVGTYNGEKVALKRLRVFAMTQDGPKQKKLFLRECLLWKNLIHENIVSFHGVSEDVFEETVCMVIAWMDNGTLASYIIAQRDEGRLRGEDYIKAADLWLYQIANGLSYLHDEGLVHGDLHGGNVLIDDTGNARLADFGMALVSESSSYGYASLHGGGAIRWKAPELIDYEEFNLPNGRPTPQSDVFSFACMCVELYSGKPPMDGVPVTQVIRRYMAGQRSQRPVLPDGGIMPDDMWTLTTSCWEQFAKDRPSSDEVVRRVAIIAGISEGDAVVYQAVMEEKKAPLTHNSSHDARKPRPIQKIPATDRSGEALALTTAMSSMSLSQKAALAPEYESRGVSKSLRYGIPKPEITAGHIGRIQEYRPQSATPSERENITASINVESQLPVLETKAFSTAEIYSLLAAAAVPSHVQMQDLPFKLAIQMLSEAFELLTRNELPSEVAGIERRTLRQICLRVIKQYTQLPARIFISGVSLDKRQTREDGALTGCYMAENRRYRVVLQALSIDSSPQANKVRQYWVIQRECLLRMSLHHEHVLTLYGLTADVVSGPGSFCLVTPRMKTTLREYVVELYTRWHLAPHALRRMVDTWLYQSAQGLSYLHSEGIIHGNLHASQILLTDGPSPSAQITGFERSLLADPSTDDDLFEDLRGGGAIRWTAPELFDPHQYTWTGVYPTYQSDVFSFALTTVEVYSGQDPYPELAESEVVRHVIQGGRPLQPVLKGLSILEPMVHSLWTLVTRCWKHIPLDRPPVAVVVETLGWIYKSHADDKRNGHKFA